MDFDTAWCPVCDNQIAPKRIQVATSTGPNSNNGIPRPRVVQNRPIMAKTRTVIDQGPYPLYCSDNCKMADLLNRREYDDAKPAPTYNIYRTCRSNTESSSPPSDFESDSYSTTTTTDVSYNSPTSENAPSLSSTTPITYQPKQRSRSFLSGRSERSSSQQYTPSSLPSTSTLLSVFDDLEVSPSADDYLLSKFQGSFSRRSESRVSLYSGPSSPTSHSPPSILHGSSPPKRERPLLANGAQGKLLVPDVYVRVPSSRPSASRRESSSSLASLASVASTSSAPGAITMRHRTGSVASIASSRASLKSPLARHGSEFGDDEKDLSEEDECAFEDSDAPLSPGLGGFGFSLSPRRPTLTERAWSFDAIGTNAFSTIRDPRRERRRSEREEDRQGFNPKKLFLFPTD